MFDLFIQPGTVAAGGARGLLSAKAVPGTVIHLIDLIQICGLVFVMWMGGRMMQLIRGSPLLGYILAGILMGPPIADQVPYLDAFLALGRLGVLLLILEAGLNMNVKMLRSAGAKAIVLTVIGMSTPILMGMAVFLSFGYSVISAFAAGATYAPTSVGMSTRILQDFNELETATGQLIITVAIVDDILSLVVLGVLQALGTTGISEETLWPILRPLVASIAFGAVLIPIAILWSPIINKVKVYVPESLRQLFCMLGFLLMAFGFGLATGTYTTELLGVFAAGVAYSGVYEVHEGWGEHIGPIAGWLARVFFLGVGFVCPLDSMMQPSTFAVGLLMSIPSIWGKVLTGLPFGGKNIIEGCKIGWGRVGRGEFAFFMAEISRNSGLLDDAGFAAVIWGLMIGSFTFPFVFRFIMMVGNKKKNKGRIEEHSVEDVPDMASDKPTVLSLKEMKKSKGVDSEAGDEPEQEKDTEKGITTAKNDDEFEPLRGNRNAPDMSMFHSDYLSPQVDPDTGKHRRPPIAAIQNARRVSAGNAAQLPQPVSSFRRASDTRRSVEFGGTNVQPQIIVIAGEAAPEPGSSNADATSPQNQNGVNRSRDREPRRVRRTGSIMALLGSYFTSEDGRTESIS